MATAAAGDDRDVAAKLQGNNDASAKEGDMDMAAVVAVVLGVGTPVAAVVL